MGEKNSPLSGNKIDNGDTSVHGARELDAVLATLADHRRRTILEHLESHGRVSLSTLAEELTQKSEDSDRKGYQIGLYHNHLPKLAELGLVDFDHGDRTVELTDRGARFRVDFGNLPLQSD